MYRDRQIQNMETMIQIRNLSKHYGRRKILAGISLDVPAGSCIGILGENGCGKSTMLSILAGTLQRDTGEFLYGEEDLFQNRRCHARAVGYVPQGTPLLEELTALDNLRLWYKNRKQIEEELENGVLGMLGIQDFLKVPVSRMSGGMKKRLSIGCAVAHRPQILLLDEPSAALDLICKERISSYLMEFKRQGGIVLLTTHDIQEIPVCDSLYILKKGKLNFYEYDGNYHHLVGNL